MPAMLGVVEMRDCETPGSKTKRPLALFSPRIFISGRPLYVRTYVRPLLTPARLLHSHPFRTPRLVAHAESLGRENADAEVGRTLLPLSRQGGRKHSDDDGRHDVAVFFLSKSGNLTSSLYQQFATTRLWLIKRILKSYPDLEVMK